jgi:hypothetical protein
MNFLQLAQRTRRKCRIAGTGPTAVTNQSEEYSRVLDWVNEAWMIIQRKHETCSGRVALHAGELQRAEETINGQAAYGRDASSTSRTWAASS